MDRKRILWAALHEIDFNKLKQLWDDPKTHRLDNGAPRGAGLTYGIALHPNDIYATARGMWQTKNSSFDLHLTDAVGGIGYDAALNNGICFQSFAPLKYISSDPDENGLYALSNKPGDGGVMFASYFPSILEDCAKIHGAELRWELFTTQAMQALRRSVQVEELISKAGKFDLYRELEHQIIFG